MKNIRSIIIEFFIVGFCIICSCAVSVTWYVCDNFIFPASYDFDNNIYSIVIHNVTGGELDNVSVYLGQDISESDTVIEIEQISNLKNNEYRKINFIADEFGMVHPYNIFVKVITDYSETNAVIGYSRKNIYKFEVAEIKVDEEEVNINVFSEYSNEYKKIYRRHRKKQMEMTWY